MTNVVKARSAKHVVKQSKVVETPSTIEVSEKQFADFAGQIGAINKSQAVIEFNLDGTILTANENFLKTLGYTLGEIQGKHHSLFVEPSYGNTPEYKQFWRDLNEGKFQAAEYKRIGKGGKEVWIQASYNPIMDLNGKPFKVVKFATDVTDNVKMRTDIRCILERVAETSTSVAAASEELSAASSQMKGNAEETSAQAIVVSAAAEQVSKNTQTVAMGIEEMGASIKEIAKNAAEAARVSISAVTVVENTNATISKLGESSDQIGKVIKVITSIAQQSGVIFRRRQSLGRPNGLASLSIARLM